MHIPKAFEINDHEIAFELVQANAFGQLVSSIDGRPVSTHLPFLVSDDHACLQGHLGIKNPQLKDLESKEVLAIFSGEHDYVSPSWYRSPGVPTWNYQAVHIYGRCKLMHEKSALRALVDGLTRKYESTMRGPWEPEYNPAMLKAIVGFEIEITDVQCQFKLSQNRSNEDRLAVIEQLKQSGQVKLAAAMQAELERGL